MSDSMRYAYLVARWQQQAEDELLIETEWIAAQIASAAEQEAYAAMQADQPKEPHA